MPKSSRSEFQTDLLLGFQGDYIIMVMITTTAPFVLMIMVVMSIRLHYDNPLLATTTTTPLPDEMPSHFCLNLHPKTTTNIHCEKSSGNHMD